MQYRKQEFSVKEDDKKEHKKGRDQEVFSEDIRW